MFIPKRRKWSATGTDNVKFTIGLTTASGGTEWRYPVLRKPADTSRPQFGIPKRKVWRQADWSKGWGQLRFDDKSAYWYSTAHTFRDGEISASAKLNDPSTNITAAGVEGFCEYSTNYYGAELLSNGTFDANATGWTAVNSTITSSHPAGAGGQSDDYATVTNVGSNNGYAHATVTTTADSLYRLTVYIKDGTSTCKVRVGSSIGGTEYATATYTSADWAQKTIYFTATGTTTYVSIGPSSSTDTQTALFDEMSCKYVGTGVGGSRTLYAWAGRDLYSYNHTTEVWSEVAITGRDANTEEDSIILDVREEGGVMYVSQLGQNYFTLTDTTWADGSAKKDHFCYHAGTIYASGDQTAGTGHTVYYGASWVNSVTVGGKEDNINAMVSFVNDLVVLKSDGVYVIGTKPQDTTIANWQPKVMPVVTFATERNADSGKHWCIWGGRLWFNAGTSLAYFDGLDVVMVEYPWSTSPAALGDSINSITAMDDCILIGYTGYVLAYSDKGVGTPGTWHHAAYLGSATRKPTALWFSRIADPDRVWIGLDDVSTDATNTKYMKMYGGLFLPYTFAASSEWYSSWFSDSDATINKWLMEVYVEAENNDANNTIAISYETDGEVSSYTSIGTIGAAATGTNIYQLPSSGYVGGSTLVSFKTLQLKATIVSQNGSVSPIIKSIEVVYQPKPPDRRQWDYTILCSDNWEADLYSANTTAEAYRDQLWTLSQQDTPCQFKDEFGDTYTVSLVLVETIPHYADGSVTGVEARIHMEEA